MENNSRRWERWSGWRVGMQRESEVAGWRTIERLRERWAERENESADIPPSFHDNQRPFPPTLPLFSVFRSHPGPLALVFSHSFPPNTSSYSTQLYNLCLYLSSLCCFYFIVWRHENLPFWKCIVFLMTSFKHVHWKVHLQVKRSHPYKLTHNFIINASITIPMIGYLEKKKCRWAYNKSIK